MKIIVTHHSPDLDAITSIWLIKKFLPGWEEAKIRFVPAGERLEVSSKKLEVIEKIGEDEIIHVDTGLGPLDHHQTKSDLVSAASLTWEFVKNQSLELRGENSQKIKDKSEAIERIVKIIVSVDHFKEALWPEASADYYEFFLHGILDGFRGQYPHREKLHVDFITKCLDAILHNFENRIWAEKEMRKGIEFEFKGEKGLGFETINDTVLPLAQKMGYVIVVRKDPRKGYVRIKVRPDSSLDLAAAYQKLKEKDLQATWFLHISRKMLLNGTTKNPKMKPTKLSLEEIIEVLKNL